MRKKIIIFVLNFLVFQLSAQLEKGTLYLGNLQLSQDLTENKFRKGIFLKSDFGYFIKDKNLIGASLGISGLSNRSYSLFYKRYFLQTKIKPFAGFSLGKKTGNLDYIHSDLKLGAAFFLNKLVALELQFEMPIHRSRGFRDFNFFPRSQSLNPNFSLGTRFFLSLDKDDSEKPIALNNFRKGIWMADVKGKLEKKQIHSDIRVLHYSLNAGGQYFFGEQSFFKFGAGVEKITNQYFILSLVYPSLKNTLESEIGLGRYFNFNDILFFRAGLTSSIKNFKHLSYSDIEIEKRQFKNVADIAMVVFKGRHRVEMGVDIENSIFSLKGNKSLSKNIFNVLPHFEYEFFVAQKFSISGRYTRTPFYRSFIPAYKRLDDEVDLDERIRDISSLDIGVRWYFK